MTSGDLVVAVERHGTAVRTAYGITLAWCPVVTAASANGISAAQAEANARLFAAAPELYEALRALVDSAILTCVHPTWPVMTAARAALAKARGEVQPCSPPMGEAGLVPHYMLDDDNGDGLMGG